jgi:hypothetical protein
MSMKITYFAIHFTHFAEIENWDYSLEEANINKPFISRFNSGCSYSRFSRYLPE